MLKKIRLRLTFFCSLVTAAILLIMTVFCLTVSERSMRAQNYADFGSNAGTLLAYIDSQSVLSHAWLARMEASLQMVISVQDGSTPLFYEQLHARDACADALSQARAIASETYQVDERHLNRSGISVTQKTFSFTDSKQNRWFATVAFLPKGQGFLNVALLAPDTLSGKGIAMQRLLFGVGALVSLVALILFSWIFTGRALAPVEESRQKQAEFIASASHELRSPLAVMLSSLSAARAASPQEQPAFFDAMESEGRRMAHLTDDLLTLAGSDSLRLSVNPAPVEADTLLLETFEKYEPLAKEKGLHLSIQLPNLEIPACRMDRDRIAQALAILMDNALSYTPAGGCVTLLLSYDGGRVAFSVADTGPGVPPKEREKIFGRFYRADNSRTDRSHFGLGLCIAREIAALHKGSVTVGTAPGGGAVFTLALPV